ncbi:acyl-CoA synthetase [Sphingomonas oryzagri]|uniref:Long-chain fatty acid--CoA ligase n=1 Tax=Sphingomonas oryzagri TaxID=3042314 RepID=A0ABT6N4W8_9SPHN|nr:long-chain fatty acid--CoA ligase [Sphingomonas oryzagri]MDH7640131.1 long-chain fatty acid--CoA ligase [Sphingomonas oryzagri]
MYITQSLHRMIQRAPDRTATIDGERRRTWAELGAEVARFAGAMRRLGVAPGDRVAILSRNGDHFLTFILGTLWAGGVINPVNLRWTVEEMAYSLVDCDTRILLVAPEFEPLVPAIRAGTPGLLHILSTEDSDRDGIVPRGRWMADAPAVEDALRRGDDLAAILYTGGTTGRPKGVMLSHANMVWAAMGSMSHPGCAPGGMFLHSAPLFHVGALSSLMIALFSGATSAFIPGFEPLAMLQAIEAWRITDAFFVPTMLRMTIDHPRFAEFDTSSVGRLRYGAAPMDDTLLDRAIEAFPNAGFCQAYGMTELSPTCCILSPEDHSAEARAEGRGRAAGRATSVCEMRIVGPDDTELPRGEVGEIVVRGPTVMQGYWNRPDATAEALRGGWMHTGDMGRMDAAGYVTVVDRLKDMIITGGENVYSAEVENVVATHPIVAAVAVIALPDERWGERVHAVIVPRPGSAADPAAIEAHCRAGLAGYKIPRSIEFVDALPLSGAGKILKTELRRQRVPPAA